jgi:hypothetical protein
LNFNEKTIISNLLLETNPVYEMEKKTLKYGIASDNVTFIDLPSEFGQTILVIDTTDHVKSKFFLWVHITLVAKFFTGFKLNF